MTVMVASGMKSWAENQDGTISAGSGTLDLHRRLADEFSEVDPDAAGWESESLSAEAGAELKKIAKFLVHPEELKPGKLEALLTKNFTRGPLQFSQLRALSQNTSMKILAPGEGMEAAVPLKPCNPANFTSQLRELAERFKGTHNRHAKFKVKEVEITDDHALTRVLFEMSGLLPEGGIQLTSTWHCKWTTDSPPRLHSLRISDYREVLPSQKGHVRFADAAPAVLGKTSGYRDHLSRSFDYWRSRSDRSLIADLLGAQGLAIADINGDELDDVYVVQQGGLPNRLFLHQPDGTARDISAESGVDLLDFGRSALLIDLDNDGDRDLVVGLAWEIALLENDGQGNFTHQKNYPSDGHINSMTATDYDNDGDLDLYLCGRDAKGAIKAEQGALGIPENAYDANNGGPNHLYRNEGAFQFQDVTKEVGLEVNNRRFSLAAAWDDFDNDGDQDLYVSNDFGRNNLFRNDPGPTPETRTFVDIAPEAGVEDLGPGMSAAWGDYNHDGLPDLYVANMWSNAGNRIIPQDAFAPSGNKETRAKARRHSKGNSVYLNQGDGTFVDLTHSSGANMARWAWSSNFIDFDNDGNRDLVVANGMITTDDTGDL